MIEDNCSETRDNSRFHASCLAVRLLSSLFCFVAWAGCYPGAKMFTSVGGYR